MKFIGLLCVAAVLGAFVSNVNATVEIGFSKQCGDNVTFSCRYTGSDNSSASASTENIDEFVNAINNLHGDTVSVTNIDREGIECNTDAYLIGDGKSMGDLVIFSDLKTSDNISRLLFDGKNVYGAPASIQFNYDSAENMNLPVVNCNNIALMRIKIGNTSEEVRCRMGGLNTDVQMGIVYNNKLRINGKTFNGFVSDVDSGDICLVANSGLNNIQQKSGKVTLGKNVIEESENFYKKYKLAEMGIGKDGNLARKKGNGYKRLDKKAWEDYKKMLKK